MHKYKIIWKVGPNDNTAIFSIAINLFVAGFVSSLKVYQDI